MSSCIEKNSTLQQKATATVLKDGTVCYTKPVRYPKRFLKALRQLWFDADCENMSEAIFSCIEGHEKNGLLCDEKIVLNKESRQSLTIRFREKHYLYINKVCATKGIDTFSEGVLNVIEEYLSSEGRL